MFLQLEQYGFPSWCSTDLTATCGLASFLVPASHYGVCYARETGGTISISALFMAGVFPGLLLGFSLIILCLAVAYREKHPHGQTVPAKDAIRIAIDASWGLITPVPYTHLALPTNTEV